MRKSRRILVAAIVIVVPLALSACSSGGSGGSSASSTSAPTTSPTDTSPTDSPTGASPTDSPTTVSPTANPTISPTTVSPSPIVGIEGITVAYDAAPVPPGTRALITGTMSASLAGTKVWIVKTNDGAPTVLGTSAPVNAQGVVRTWVQLQRTGVLKLVILRNPTSPSPSPTGSPSASPTVRSTPFDPNAALLASSAPFTVTVS